MIAQKQSELVFPARWWSFGPFWRYERPQKGQSREFFQWNIDLIGPNSPEADAELISIAVEFLRKTGLKPDQVAIRVNNRKLMESSLLAIGISSDQVRQVFKLIDRKDKLSVDAWRVYAGEQGFTPDQVQKLEVLLSDQQLWKKSDDLTRLFELIEATGHQDYIKFDPNIIRGLDYYTGTVFEARDRDGEFRAILGGGRYNNLVGDVGGQPVGGIGFAMGDMVIRLVLQKYGCLPELSLFPAKVMVTVFDENSAVKSYKMAADLRRDGLAATCYPEIAKLPKQFKYADRTGIRMILVLGPDEQAKGQVTIKDLTDGSQVLVEEKELSEFIKAKLA
jgi:histidyl-tRNA synthetase